jgi:hypothetical protein
MSIYDGGNSDSTYGSSTLDGGLANSTFEAFNSTDIYWDVDGVSLQTFAFDIQTIGGDRLAPPPLRGRDLLIPYTPGELYVPKQVGARVITLDMFVLGCNEDGSIPTGSASAKFDENFRKLRQLLWTPNRRFVLTKRFYADGQVRTAKALAQYAGGLAPSMTGRTRAVFSVDLRLSDPYFYEDPISTTLYTGTQDVFVAGDDCTRAIGLYVNGPRDNVKIRNTSLDVQVEYPLDLSSGDTLTIDVKQFNAVTDPANASPWNSTGRIRHAGDAHWMLLQPGINTLVVSSSSGIGGVFMSHQAVWL